MATFYRNCAVSNTQRKSLYKYDKLPLKYIGTHTDEKTTCINNLHHSNLFLYPFYTLSTSAFFRNGKNLLSLTAVYKTCVTNI